MLRVRVLGDLEVAVDGEVADLGGPKPRALLALLVAAGGRPVPVEQLIDQMWGEDPPARVEASLQSHVARLRRVVEPQRDARGRAERLLTHAGGYSLHVPADDVDARVFVDLVREQRHEEALELWRGRPYAGLDCPSLEAEATRLDELRLGALADLWRARIDAGRHAEAVAELEQLVRAHPWREQLWALLALALYRDARQGDALAALRRARHHLAHELGVDPGPELRRLEEAVLRQDPSLDVPSGAAAGPASRPPSSTSVEPAPTPAGPVLFGRDDALADAAAALADAREGRGRTVLVSGEPGIGKTRLTEALAARAAAEGFRVGRGGWEAEECPLLWGWTRALAGALGEAPPLDDDARPTDAASASFRRADALVGVLRDGPPTLLVLDDVHWADLESLRLLRRTAAEVERLPVVLVVTTRDSAAETEGPVADLLAALARVDPVRLDLHGLGPDDVTAWVAEHAGVRLGAEAATELVARTGGNPFFVGELVRLLRREGALGDPLSRAWTAVPSGVRDVVRARVAGLGAAAADTLGLAAVVGRTFDPDVVAAALGRGADEVAEALETVQVHGLVDEEAPGRYRFTHALVRDALYDGLTAPARARAHGVVAAALEDRHAGRVAEHAAELAEHYRLAGRAYARSAWLFAQRAAEAAAGANAHDEALRLLADAARLQGLDHETSAEERERVLLGQARALNWLGRPIDAWPCVAEAATSALDRGEPEAAARALLVVTEGFVWGWRPHPEWDDDAIALWRRVLDAQPEDDLLARALLQAALAAEHLYRPGPIETATRLADEAIALARRSDAHPHERLHVLRLALMAWLRPELLHRRMAVNDEIIELATRCGDDLALAAALTQRAAGRAELGRLDAAHADALRAHQIAIAGHLTQGLVVSGWWLALRHQLDEDWEAAERAIAEHQAFQSTLAMSGEGIGLAQLVGVADARGRLPEMEPTLRQVGQHHPAYRELHSLSIVRAGDLDTLRRTIGEWGDQPAIPRDYMWLPLVAIRAEVWAALGDRTALLELRADLAPYADRMAMCGPVIFRGAVRHVLGLVAAALGETEEARAHLEAGLERHAELGLGAWVAASEAALAALPA